MRRICSAIAGVAAELEETTGTGETWRRRECLAAAAALSCSAEKERCGQGREEAERRADGEEADLLRPGKEGVDRSSNRSHMSDTIGHSSTPTIASSPPPPSDWSEAAGEGEILVSAVSVSTTVVVATAASTLCPSRLA